MRERLVRVVETFAGVMMLTLTVDPELFDSPEAAWRYVREQRGVARLMRTLDRWGHLHSRRYWYVWEAHQSGWLHLHVLVDASYIPHADLELAWGAIRPRGAGPAPEGRPRFGHVWFSGGRGAKGGAFSSASHAAAYATKYLSKCPRNGWPGWIMALGADERFRRYDVSRGFWGEPGQRQEPEHSRNLRRETYAVRVASCGSTCNVFVRVERVDHATGEVDLRPCWRGQLALDVRDLQAVPDGMDDRRRRREFETWGQAAAAIARRWGAVPEWVRMRAGGVTEGVT